MLFGTIIVSVILENSSCIKANRLKNVVRNQLDQLPLPSNSDTKSHGQNVCSRIDG